MSDRVLVQAIVSFNAVRKGDRAWVELTPDIDNHIHAGYLRVLEVEAPENGETDPGPSGDPESGEDSGGE